MTDRLRKPTVKLAGQTLTAHNAIAWKFQTGVHPFVTTFSVQTDIWDRIMVNQRGVPLILEVVDSRGVKTQIQGIYILHVAPSSNPTVTTFVVADLRWRWNRKLVARTYNLSRRTGDTNFDGKTIPVESRVTTPAYDYQPFSLVKGEEIWTAEDAVLDVLHHLEKPADIIVGKAFDNLGQFTLQNIALRDQGDTALARLMAFVPGIDVWVDKKGKVRVINTLDLAAGERARDKLPPSTYDGDKDEMIDRSKIRPRAVHVFYEREVEMVIDYRDSITKTSAPRPRDVFYAENVIATTDPSTTITEFDAELNADVTKDVPPGTWVSLNAWLAAMDKIRPTGSVPWDFEVIKRAWLKGDLEAQMIGDNLRGVDEVDTTNVINAVRALRQSFRQTFRINRRYMSRIREIRNVRVALLDPVTGARMPSSVWGQICVAPTTKGTHIATRKNEDKASLYFNVDTLPAAGEQLVKKAPGPQALSFIDVDAGIFRLDTNDSPYGDSSAVFPSLVTGANGGAPTAPTRNLRDQDSKAIGAGMRLQSGTNEIALSSSMKFRAIVTVTPGSPNNKGAFHVEKVPASEVSAQFGSKFRVGKSEGPPLEVYIPPSEMTARFAWRDDEKAAATVVRLLGLNSDDPTKGGLVDDPETEEIDESLLNGFELINAARELPDHSRAVAAEMMSPYADSLQGRITSRVPDNGNFELHGNMAGATLQVAAAPSGKVNAVHEFPGQAAPVNRLALMSESARKVVLGIVRFK